eukprot:gnl/Dysnectes_brevis/4471_a6022_406.p1 GENE.gnl/Dysnectes_brevis/4471_a6022_406~~gnl/Dysnectes_brevis/4471_a6022_406.p1  ORF type:complete len:2568 (-),score=581.59 gnl/Dysnectes_brevis/4471_a6022_406:48-7751(-)
MTSVNISDIASQLEESFSVFGLTGGSEHICASKDQFSKSSEQLSDPHSITTSLKQTLSMLAQTLDKLEADLPLSKMVDLAPDPFSSRPLRDSIRPGDLFVRAWIPQGAEQRELQHLRRVIPHMPSDKRRLRSMAYLQLVIKAGTYLCRRPERRELLLLAERCALMGATARPPTSKIPGTEDASLSLMLAFSFGVLMKSHLAAWLHMASRPQHWKLDRLLHPAGLLARSSHFTRPVEDTLRAWAEQGDAVSRHLANASQAAADLLVLPIPSRVSDSVFRLVTELALTVVSEMEKTIRTGVGVAELPVPPSLPQSLSCLLQLLIDPTLMPAARPIAQHKGPWAKALPAVARLVRLQALTTEEHVCGRYLGEVHGSSGKLAGKGGPSHLASDRTQARLTRSASQAGESGFAERWVLDFAIESSHAQRRLVALRKPRFTVSDAPVKAAARSLIRFLSFISEAEKVYMPSHPLLGCASATSSRLDLSECVLDAGRSLFTASLLCKASEGQNRAKRGDDLVAGALNALKQVLEANKKDIMGISSPLVELAWTAELVSTVSTWLISSSRQIRTERGKAVLAELRTILAAASSRLAALLAVPTEARHGLLFRRPHEPLALELTKCRLVLDQSCQLSPKLLCWAAEAMLVPLRPSFLSGTPWALASRHGGSCTSSSVACGRGGTQTDLGSFFCEHVTDKLKIAQSMLHRNDRSLSVLVHSATGIASLCQQLLTMDADQLPQGGLCDGQKGIQQLMSSGRVLAASWHDCTTISLTTRLRHSLVASWALLAELHLKGPAPSKHHSQLLQTALTAAVWAHQAADLATACYDAKSAFEASIIGCSIWHTAGQVLPPNASAILYAALIPSVGVNPCPNGWQGHPAMRRTCCCCCCDGRSRAEFTASASALLRSLCSTSPDQSPRMLAEADPHGEMGVGAARSVASGDFILMCHGILSCLHIDNLHEPLTVLLRGMSCSLGQLAAEERRAMSDCLELVTPDRTRLPRNADDHLDPNELTSAVYEASFLLPPNSPLLLLLKLSAALTSLGAAFTVLNKDQKLAFLAASEFHACKCEELLIRLPPSSARSALFAELRILRGYTRADLLGGRECVVHFLGGLRSLCGVDSTAILFPRSQAIPRPVFSLLSGHICLHTLVTSLRTMHAIWQRGPGAWRRESLWQESALLDGIMVAGLRLWAVVGGTTSQQGLQEACQPEFLAALAPTLSAGRVNAPATAGAHVRLAQLLFDPSCPSSCLLADVHGNLLEQQQAPVATELHGFRSHPGVPKSRRFCALALLPWLLEAAELILDCALPLHAAVLARLALSLAPEYHDGSSMARWNAAALVASASAILAHCGEELAPLGADSWAECSHMARRAIDHPLSALGPKSSLRRDREGSAAELRWVDAVLRLGRAAASLDHLEVVTSAIRLLGKGSREHKLTGRFALELDLLRGLRADSIGDRNCVESTLGRILAYLTQKRPDTDAVRGATASSDGVDASDAFPEFIVGERPLSLPACVQLFRLAARARSRWPTQEMEVLTDAIMQSLRSDHSSPLSKRLLDAANADAHISRSFINMYRTTPEHSLAASSLHALSAVPDFLGAHLTAAALSQAMLEDSLHGMRHLTILPHPEEAPDLRRALSAIASLAKHDVPLAVRRAFLLTAYLLHCPEVPPGSRRAAVERGQLWLVDSRIRMVLCMAIGLSALKTWQHARLPVTRATLAAEHIVGAACARLILSRTSKASALSISSQDDVRIGLAGKDATASSVGVFGTPILSLGGGAREISLDEGEELCSEVIERIDAGLAWWGVQMPVSLRRTPSKSPFPHIELSHVLNAAYPWEEATRAEDSESSLTSSFIPSPRPRHTSYRESVMPDTALLARLLLTRAELTVAKEQLDFQRVLRDSAAASATLRVRSPVSLQEDQIDMAIKPAATVIAAAPFYHSDNHLFALNQLPSLLHVALPPPPFPEREHKPTQPLGRSELTESETLIYRRIRHHAGQYLHDTQLENAALVVHMSLSLALITNQMALAAHALDTLLEMRFSTRLMAGVDDSTDEYACLLVALSCEIISELENALLKTSLITHLSETRVSRPPGFTDLMARGAAVEHTTLRRLHINTPYLMATPPVIPLRPGSKAFKTRTTKLFNRSTGLAPTLLRILSAQTSSPPPAPQAPQASKAPELHPCLQGGRQLGRVRARALLQEIAGGTVTPAGPAGVLAGILWRSVNKLDGTATLVFQRQTHAWCSCMQRDQTKGVLKCPTTRAAAPVEALCAAAWRYDHWVLDLAALFLRHPSAMPASLTRFRHEATLEGLPPGAMQPFPPEVSQMSESWSQITAGPLSNIFEGFRDQREPLTGTLRVVGPMALLSLPLSTLIEPHTQVARLFSPRALATPLTVPVPPPVATEGGQHRVLLAIPPEALGDDPPAVSAAMRQTLGCPLLAVPGASAAAAVTGVHSRDTLLLSPSAPAGDLFPLSALTAATQADCNVVLIDRAVARSWRRLSSGDVLRASPVVVSRLLLEAGVCRVFSPICPTTVTANSSSVMFHLAKENSDLFQVVRNMMNGLELEFLRHSGAWFIGEAILDQKES